MSTYSTDRRSVLKILSSIGATCAYPFAGDELYGQTEPAHVHVAAPPQTATTFFRQEDLATISRIADLIIPETDTPGAANSGVPAYIDMVVSRNTDQQLLMADGLRWLDAEATRTAEKNFMQLSEKQQLSILEPLCEAVDAGGSHARNVQFFGLVKRLTADGYYTSRIGLIEELGYKGNTVRAEFPDCVHEH
ncbi:MAG: gluconate 2-dehydrogenase subunit 3 family protein [Acidobacteriota bacterium]|nr:gluconate 2-dehydrogenase subunit 3 family protein [Acidobacteriota bacterium]